MAQINMNRKAQSSRELDWNLKQDFEEEEEEEEEGRKEGRKEEEGEVMMAMEGNSNGEEFAVGCILSIKTTLGDEFEGQVIAFDRPSNILVLQEGIKVAAAGPKRNIRLLKANYIKDFSYLGQGEDPLDATKCYFDLNALQAREQSAVRQAEIDSERIGVGVTPQAQNLFDALFKTLPVRWDKTVIVVMNEVRVSSPYLPESVSGGTAAANDRVRKVLELERKRLQSRSGSH